MSCNLEQALAKVEKLLKFSAIQKNIPFEVKRIEFEIKAMMAAKDKMTRGPEVVSNDGKLKTTSKKPTPEFDTLPEYVPGQKNMTYAGIGSRKTPPEIITQMTEIGNYLDGLGYKLQTGKTFNNKEEGADQAFSKGSSNKELFGPEQANAQTIKIAKEIHPAPQNLKPGGLKLMARNTYQIFGSNLDIPVDFVLFYAKEGKGIRPEGGTGQAVEMARLKGIPTVNMADKNWRVKLQEVLSNKKLSNKETVKNAEVKPTEDEKIKNPNSGYKTSETELALDEYLAPDSTLEASTKSEDSIINVEKVGKQSTKDKLNLLLKAYDSASGIIIGGGYVENMQVKDGYRVSDMDEDVKKGTIEKGMYQESVADLLPKLEKRVSTYLKSYDKYYNELNRTAGVRRDIEYLLDILNKVSSEPYVAEAVGIKVEEDVLIQEDTPINELIKDGIHCKNKG